MSIAQKSAVTSVQAPTKYGLAINFKAAKALGLEVAPSLLARAHEVIERRDGSSLLWALWLHLGPLPHLPRG